MTQTFEFMIHLQEMAWREALPDYHAIIDTAARATLQAEEINKATLNFALMNDTAVQALNHQFRGLDKPTNVLSFEDGSDQGLGDIALALETIQREASEQGKTLEAHFTHLVIHGVLHLLGYDHMNEAEAQTMEAKEIAILSSMGIENPYDAE